MLLMLLLSQPLFCKQFKANTSTTKDTMGGKRALAGLDLDNILVTKSRRRGSTVSETMAGTPLIDETTTKPVLQGPPEVKTVDPGDDDDEATASWNDGRGDRRAEKF